MGIEQLPQYRSHKIVRAAVYLGELANSNARVARLSVRIGGDATAEIEVPEAIFTRGRPVEGQDYIVVYEDGYASWSPKAAFEDGYTAVEADAAAEAGEPQPAGESDPERTGDAGGGEQRELAG